MSMISYWIYKLFYSHKRSTGLIKQQPDERDYKYKISGNTANMVDLRSKESPVSYQNGYNSCVYHAVGDLMDYTLKYKKKVSWPGFMFSEAYGWYYGRKRLGTENSNSGTVLRDAFKVILDKGFVPRELWDYKNGIYSEPDSKAQIGGQMFKLYLSQIPGYYTFDNVLNIPRVPAIKNALSKGYEVAFGIKIDSDFQKLKVSDPYVDSFTTLRRGGHAMKIVGYTDTHFIVKNSWGNSWGEAGYCYIGFDLFEKEAYDTWTLM